VKRILVEGLVVATIGAVLAFLANGLSPRGLKLTRNYFPGSAALTVTAGPGDTQPSGLGRPKGLSASELLATRLRAEGLQVADSNLVSRLFHDPRFEQNLVLFLDARDDEHYQAGHIPGAYPFDYFHPEQYLGPLLPLLQSAEQVVVYCNGGDCEDSRQAAITLRNEVAVPAGKLFVYAGGIAEWSTNGWPVELGSRNSGKLLSSK